MNLMVNRLCIDVVLVDLIEISGYVSLVIYIVYLIFLVFCIQNSIEIFRHYCCVS